MDYESLLTAARFRPNHLSFPDAWIGHIPFAAWLIQGIEPSVFVELGTHSGNSYLAFCQAVRDADLLTKCYAVDTWKGDEHAGYYDESVFQNLYPYHQEHYGSFSRLLRLTFDDANQYFSEGSIGLLHIDGLHTYEAIKHDFETWLPKLTPHAVVLLHGTNVREKGFGVWRFWEELCAQYPLNLQFIHSSGLGVLQLSEGKGTFNLNWLRTGSPHRHLLLDYFAAIGKRNIEQYQNQELKQAVNEKEQSVHLYLDLMKKCLTDIIYADTQEQPNLSAQPFDESQRMEGLDWPAYAHTMIGMKRLDNIQFCVEDVIKRQIPGDLIETGVWRGGATIFMRAILKAYDINDRNVWVADSFEGLPPPNPEDYPTDTGDKLNEFKELAVSMEQVQSNFAKYGLLDHQVKFLKGWFRDTLAAAPIEKLAVLRLDGDMYESTMEALNALYPKLGIGGYLIVDDYGAMPSCKKAINDYREKHQIYNEMIPIDWTGIFWQKCH